MLVRSQDFFSDETGCLTFSKKEIEDCMRRVDLIYLVHGSAIYDSIGHCKASLVLSAPLSFNSFSLVFGSWCK